MLLPRFLLNFKLVLCNNSFHRIKNCSFCRLNMRKSSSFNQSPQHENSKPDDDLKLDPKPYLKDNSHTWIGPPHPVSNLRRKVFPTTENLTDDEKRFYRIYKEVEDWNQKHWEIHNHDFEDSKKAFIQKVKKEKNIPEDIALTAEDMSSFYKLFLDRNHKKHAAYNWQWYQRHFYLLYLAARANISKLKQRLWSSIQR